MEVDTRAVRARSSCQLRSPPVHCNKTEIVNSETERLRGLSFCFEPVSSGPVALAVTPFPPLLCQFLPGCSQKTFSPPNFQLSFKRSSASAAQRHRWCDASAGRGCCAPAALPSLRHGSLLLTCPLRCLWRRLLP